MGSMLVFNLDGNIFHLMDNNSALQEKSKVVNHPEPIQDETAEEWKSVLFDQFGVVGLSRMPPRVFLTLIKERASIRDELRGILSKDHAGIPIGELVWLTDERVVKLPKVRTTMVTKLKANGGIPKSPMPAGRYHVFDSSAIRKRSYCSEGISSLILLHFCEYRLYDLAARRYLQGVSAKRLFAPGG